MPPPDVIVGGLTTIANQWRWLAVAWHLALGVMLIALVAGWRPSHRLISLLLVTPLASVAGLAWLGGNPFNAGVFAAMASLLCTAVSRQTSRPVRLATGWRLWCGVFLIAYAWVYPHFVSTASRLVLLYAAPLGLVPCPTIAALIGLTMFLDLLDATTWSALLALMGLTYGTIGVFRLDVALDWALLAGAVMLVVGVVERRRNGLIRP